MQAFDEASVILGVDFRADVYVLGEASPPEYVIAHELRYRREGGSVQHVRDVRARLAVSGELIDRPLLARLVAQLGVRAQWDEVLGDAR